MGAATGIAWTDSTANYWEGCTKVGPGCDHCYAADRDARWHAGSHWGPGAPRRLMSQNTRNNLSRWQHQAPEFLAEHGRRRRVFCSSLSDVFDNEVPESWREAFFAEMERAPDLLIQLCTKRVGNVLKMVPKHWLPDFAPAAPVGRPTKRWPANVGLLITVVTELEVRRDVPKLMRLKRDLGIPWVGLSIEPLIEDVVDELRFAFANHGKVDWMIVGGESGPDARRYDLTWGHAIAMLGQELGIAVFHKQLGARPQYRGNAIKLKDRAGADMDEWPGGSLLLKVRQFPPQLAA